MYIVTIVGLFMIDCIVLYAFYLLSAYHFMFFAMLMTLDFIMFLSIFTITLFGGIKFITLIVLDCACM